MSAPMLHEAPMTAGMLHTLTDRVRLHRYAMALLPVHGLGANPRAKAGFQYRVDLPGDVLGSDQAVRFSWRGAGSGQVEVEVGQELQVMVRVSASSRVEGRMVAWADAVAWEKTRALLERHGLGLQEGLPRDPLVIGPAVMGVAGAQRDVLAQVVVANETLAQAAFDNGIGRAKNYGLGMLLVAEAN